MKELGRAINRRWDTVKAFEDDLRAELDLREIPGEWNKVHQRTFRLPSQVLLGILAGVTVVGRVVELAGLMARRSKRKN